MNLGQFRTAVNRRTGIAVDPSALSEMVNEAIQAIGAERNWLWLESTDTFTTTDGDPDYTLPADWAQTRAISVNGEPARMLNIADGDTYPTLDEAPLWTYSISDGTIIFYPTPGEADVVHRYVATEQPLTSDSDEPLLPARFHQAAVNYTAAIVCDRSDDGRSTKYRDEYERWLKRMRDENQRNRQPQRIRVRPGAGW